MADDPPLCQVEVSFAGTPPVSQVARAAGVTDVQAGRFTLRCLVCGSFQPFLEALRGHEVLSLTSLPVLDDSRPPASSPSPPPDHEATHGR